MENFKYRQKPQISCPITFDKPKGDIMPDFLPGLPLMNPTFTLTVKQNKTKFNKLNEKVS